MNTNKTSVAKINMDNGEQDEVMRRYNLKKNIKSFHHGYENKLKYTFCYVL